MIHIGLYISVMFFAATILHFIIGHEVLFNKEPKKRQSLFANALIFSFFGLGFYLTLYDDIKVMVHYDSLKVGNLSIMDMSGRKGKTIVYEGILIEKKVKRNIFDKNMFGTEIDYDKYYFDDNFKPPYDTIPVYYSEKHNILIARNHVTTKRKYLEDRIFKCFLGFLICNSLFYWLFHRKIWDYLDNKNSDK